MRYTVIEIQTGTDGKVANLVTTYETRNEAESAFHSVLAAAALSSLPVHAASILTNEGALVETRCYRHELEEGA